MKFANIADIQQSQIDAGEVKSDTDESSESERHSEAEDCIVVGGGQAE
ncbi:hypothetical protein CSPAE12_05982 [Colletotrichum incanum]|nr:hypothetical protein CSPAE12_05982 [Colletotrichum incanum]